MKRNRGPSPWQALKRTVRGGESIVVQAGANTGDELRPFKNLWPYSTIYAFEPRPSPQVKLQANADKYMDIYVIKKALSNKTGRMTLHVNQMVGTSSLYPINTESSCFRPDYTEKGTLEVGTITLDEFLPTDSISLLYSDTQGSELNILKGAERMLSEGRIGALFLEVFFVELYENVPLFYDVKREMERHSYRLDGLYCVAKWYGTGQTMWADALFVKGD